MNCPAWLQVERVLYSSGYPLSRAPRFGQSSSGQRRTLCRAQKPYHLPALRVRHVPPLVQTVVERLRHATCVCAGCSPIMLSVSGPAIRNARNRSRPAGHRDPSRRKRMPSLHMQWGDGWPGPQGFPRTWTHQGRQRPLRTGSPICFSTHGNVGPMLDRHTPINPSRSWPCFWIGLLSSAASTGAIPCVPGWISSAVTYNEVAGQ